MQEFVFQIAEQREALHPVEFAGWLHIRLVNIHPFIDGNGSNEPFINLLSNMVWEAQREYLCLVQSLYGG